MQHHGYLPKRPGHLKSHIALSPATRHLGFCDLDHWGDGNCDSGAWCILFLEVVAAHSVRTPP